MKIFTNLFLLLLFSTTHAQYIRNGSVEVGNPEAPCAVDSVRYWEVVNSTTHLLHKEEDCFPPRASLSQSFKNIKGSIPDKNRIIWIHAESFFGNPSKESFGQQLQQKLIKGQQYRLSFHTTFIDFGLNKTVKLIVGFSAGKPSEIGDLYRDTLTLHHKEEWLKYSYCFTAKDDSVDYISFTSFYNYNNFTGGFKAAVFLDSIGLDTGISLGLEDKILCKGDTLTMDATDPYALTYKWGGLNALPSIEAVYNISKAGTYWVSVEDLCGTKTDTVHVLNHIPPSFAFESQPDSSLCVGDTFQLKASYPEVTYRWNDNSTDSVYTVTQEGVYWVELTDQCNSTASDTVSIDYDSLPELDLGEDFILCRNDSVVLNVSQPKSTYRWQDGSFEPAYAIRQEGTYWVNVTHKCGAVSDTVVASYTEKPSINSIEHLNSVILATKNQYDSYQWIYCDSTAIDEATYPIYTASLNGNYALVVEQLGCFDTSNCITVGIQEIEAKKLSIYPNPTLQSITIDIPHAYNGVSIVIRNAIGQLIKRKQFSNTEEIIFELMASKGSYIIEVQIDDLEVEYFKVIKQ